MNSSDNDTLNGGELTVRLLVAYLQQNPVPIGELPGLVRDLRRALEQPLPDVDAPSGSKANVRTEQPALTPAVPIEQSLTDQFIISLEDGRPYRSLKRHLMARYAMTPEDYRRKWGLPEDYPMVAPGYARERSEVAKRIGLGKTVQESPRSRRSRGR